MKTKIDKIKNPNIIFILLDGTRLEFFENSNPFNELKEKSILLSNLITPAPYTLPSLSSIFTGLYPKNHGNNAYFNAYNQKDLTITDYLNDLDYSTYSCIDELSQSFLPVKNFDEVLTYDEFKDDITSKHLDYTEKTFNENKNRPFFLYLHHPGTHKELVKQVTRHHNEFEKKLYGPEGKLNTISQSQINEISNYLDRVKSLIDQKDKDDNTILIVMSDHGTTAGERIGEFMYGVYLYNYTIKTYAFLKFPQKMEIGTRIIDMYCSTLDIKPTILDILGLKANNQIDGISLKKLFVNGQDKNIDHRIFISETGGVSGPFPSPYRPNVFSCIKYPWKLIYYTATGKFDFFNIEKDPFEMEPINDNLHEFSICYENLMSYIIDESNLLRKAPFAHI